MAEIYRAKISTIHGFEKTLVVKCLLPELVHQPQYLDMFVTEARIMAQFSHPNVVDVLDFGNVDGVYFIAMEFVDGIDVQKVLALCVRQRRRLPTAIAVHVVSELLKALEQVHLLTDADGTPLRVVHRDISPSNILISRLGEVKLSDFGVAKAAIRTETSQIGELKGKYGYVAPEMIGGAPVDSRADLFSAGVVLAEMLMARRLFLGKTDLDTVLQVRDVNLSRLDRYGKHIPQVLRDVLYAALARDPHTRYQSAAVFRSALRRYLFDHRMLVQDTEVREFVEKIQAQVDDPPLLPRQVVNTGDGEYPVAELDAPPAREERTPVQVPHTIGVKRRISLTPPKEVPPPALQHDDNEDWRLSTYDALEAVAELDSSARGQAPALRPPEAVEGAPNRPADHRPGPRQSRSARGLQAHRRSGPAEPSFG